MKTMVVLCTLLAASTNALPQEMLTLPTWMEQVGQSGGPKKPKADTSEGSFDLFFRYSSIGGDDGAGGEWSDDFSNGLGFRLRGSYEYHVSQEVSVGAYLSTGYDSFGGKSSGGASLDDLEVYATTIGLQAKLYVGSRFLAEAYAGFGVVSYSQVDGHFAGQSISVFEPTSATAFELGAHVIYKLNVDHGRAPTPQFGIMLGVGYEHWGEPDSALAGTTAKPIENVTFDLGFWFGF